MRIPSYTGQFKRDVKLAQKRGKDMGKLKSIIAYLKPTVLSIASCWSKGKWSLLYVNDISGLTKKPARASFDVEERVVLQVILRNYDASSQEKESWPLSWVDDLRNSRYALK